MLREWIEEEIVQISALQHYSYCPRQCALIHVEQVFDENLYTLRGRRVHENADVPEGATEDGLRVERGMPLWSERLGLIGKADVVELPAVGPPLPVEYKAGPRGPGVPDEVQLCAQALCLEEMLGESVPQGVIFQHASRARREVEMDEELRSLCEKVIHEVRGIISRSEVPPPVADARCNKCSLIDACMPFELARNSFDSEELFEP